MNTVNKDSSSQCWSNLFAGLGNCAQQGLELKEKFAFLQDIEPLPNNVINFGSSMKWDSWAGYTGGLEPFALLWTLQVSKVVVVDIDKNSVDILRKYVGEFKEKYLQCFEGHTDCFEYLVADMTSADEMSRLPPKHFELAYCSRVLLSIEHSNGLDGVRKAITEMARVVKPGGCTVSHEADKLEPYPTRYADIFMETGFDKPKIIRQPESINMPDFQIEYAIYKRLA